MACHNFSLANCFLLIMLTDSISSYTVLLCTHVTIQAFRRNQHLCNNCIVVTMDLKEPTVIIINVAIKFKEQ